jgi:hypothetical protein
MPDLDESTAMPEATMSNASGVSATGKAPQRSSGKRRPAVSPDSPDGVFQGNDRRAVAAEGEPDPLPPLSNSRLARERASPSISRLVEESPAHAPGSGQRRILVSDASTPSLRKLRAAVVAGPPESTPTQATSSPLARKSRGRPSLSRERTASVRKSIPTGTDEEDELSPAATRKNTDRDDELEDVAEAITDQHAARVLGRKRPRRSARVLTEAEEAYESAEHETEEAELPPAKPTCKRAAEDVYDIEADDPAPKRQKHVMQPPSPAKQSQPKRTERKQAAPRRQEKARPEAEKAPDDLEAGDTISVTVQRLTKPRHAAPDEVADDTDELHPDIAFASSKDPNVVDVLAQSIDEIIAQEVEKIKGLGRGSDDSNVRKECKVKLQGLEMFRSEIKTQLLSHVSLRVASYCREENGALMTACLL